MKQEKSHKAFSDEAIAWLIRLESGEATSSDYQHFARWRAQSAAHVAAFEEISSLWRDLNGLTAGLAPSVPMQSPENTLPNVGSKNRWPSWTASFCILLFCVVSPMLMSTGMVYFASDYRTGIGAPTTITLADGSQVVLDADSALSVEYTSDVRSLTLRQGRGYFVVAADKQRPFVVNSNDGQTRALGTEFEVDATRQSVVVTVFESEVEVSLDGKPARLEAGQRLNYSPEAGMSMPQAVKLQQAGAWRDGKLLFSDEPLAEVVEEINRYRRGLIVIMDDSLREIRVSGVFDLHQPDSLLQALTEVFPVQQRSLTSYLVLLDRL